MIRLKLSIPRKPPKVFPKDWYYREWKIKEHKYLELQIVCFRGEFTLFEFELSAYPYSDHRPVNLYLTLLNLSIYFTYYDSRHVEEDDE